MTQPPYPPSPGQQPPHYTQQPFAQRPTALPPPSPVQAPPRRRRKWPWIAGGVVALIVIIAAVNGSGDDASPTSPTAAAPPSTAALAGQPASAAPPAAPAQSAPARQQSRSGKDKITYEVTGKGVSRASITYVKDEHMSQQQENGASLPWSRTVEMDGGVFSFQPLSMVAQSQSGGGGSITCRILRNGDEVTSSTSSGPYAVVTCSGGV